MSTDNMTNQCHATPETAQAAFKNNYKILPKTDESIERARVIALHDVDADV
jgi:hypothetical protein